MHLAVPVDLHCVARYLYYYDNGIARTQARGRRGSHADTKECFPKFILLSISIVVPNVLAHGDLHPFEMSQNTPGPSRALEIQVPCIVFLIITPAFVAIRLWSRFNSKSGLGGDDWTILASTVSSSCDIRLQCAD
jgi:hypothetical protein